jgi:hypothetical protein
VNGKCDSSKNSCTYEKITPNQLNIFEVSKTATECAISYKLAIDQHGFDLNNIGQCSSA